MVTRLCILSHGIWKLIILILLATGMLAQGHAVFDKQVILFSIIFFINYSITLVNANAIHRSV